LYFMLDCQFGFSEAIDTCRQLISLQHSCRKVFTFRLTSSATEIEIQSLLRGSSVNQELDPEDSI
jgi:hypothetical protein